ncbi:MAG: hypothetical protein PF795_10865 [Kiritimatiellae bacterium]|jgi:hypothetical protein|nr:hypothetical protein [Kiritimatiellia bacterium]
MTEKAIIRDHRDFQEALLEVTTLPPFPGAAWKWVTGSGNRAPVLTLELDGQPAVNFQVEFKSKLTPRIVQSLTCRSDDSGLEPLVVCVDASEEVAQVCFEKGLAMLSLNGRLVIRKPGLMINLSEKASNTRYVNPGPKISPFTPKSSRVTRALLADWDREWKLADLSNTVEISLSRVSEVLGELSNNGWVAGSRGDWHVEDGVGLLDAWAQDDDFKTRVRVYQYASLKSHNDLARALLETGKEETTVFTQWFAAIQRFPFSQAPVCCAYRRHPLSKMEQEASGLQAVGNGGTLWLLVPKDDGVFQFQQQGKGVPLVSDAQIYLDLLQVGMRGPDQAKALREWEGFCR